MNSFFIKATTLFLLCITGHSDDAISNGTGVPEDNNPPTCFNIVLAPKPRSIYNYDNVDPYRGEPHNSEISYHLFDSYGNQVLSSNATANRICYESNSEECHYLFLSGHGLFMTFDDNNAVLNQGELMFGRPKLIRMGLCAHQCYEEQQQLVLVGERNENPGLYEAGKNPKAAKQIVVKDAVVMGDDTLVLKTMCVNPTGCYKLIGSAVYMLSRNDSIIEEQGTTYDGYKIIGASENCYHRCDEKPLLVETKRGQEITLTLSSISGMELLTNVNSPQYLAACWLIHDDSRQLTSSDSNIIQRYILALLFYTLNGPRWAINYDFLTHKDECEWTKWTYFYWLRFFFRDGNGVLCNDSGEVSKIILVENNLAGTLPPEISWLTQVDYLEFSHNSIHGTIPYGFGRLKNLEKFRFRGNGLTGTLPQSFGQIEPLVMVDVGNNMLEGDMVSIPRPCNLYAIDLRNNMITGSIPNEIGGCSLLGVLNLNNNFVTGTLPESIGDLRYLDRVSLQSNSFIGSIPSKILSLPYLTTLWMSNNTLSGRLPSNVTDESSLTGLLLDHNQLTGTVPPAFSHLKRMRHLYLQHNHLTGEIPSDLTKLERLSASFFQNNDFTGTVPFETCEQFQHLEADCGSPEKVSCTCCSDCHGIFRDVHDDESACHSREIKVHFEGLSPGDNINFMMEYSSGGIIDNYVFTADGASHTYTTCISTSSCFKLIFSQWASVPFEMTVLLNDELITEEFVSEPAQTYHFGYSSYEGGSMAQDTCESFEMCNTVLEPNSTKRQLINKLTRITGIDVLKNSTSPYYKASCEWVKFLGTKSDEESTQSKLLQHYILALLYFITNGEGWYNSTSWLTDESFCSWYGVSCDSYDIITTMDLSFNNLVGTLPTEIAELRGLEQLVLSFNHISGTIPFEIGKLQRLKQLRASHNVLMGNLPSEIGLLSDIMEVDLSFNQLADTIPTEVGMLGSIQKFELYNNTFSGEIPNSFYALTDLRYLSLGANLFAGDARRVGRFLNLEMLDLSDNFFTGSIPLNGYLNKLRVVRLSGNRFEGSIPMTIGQMQMLEEIFLYSNRLTGNLPSEFGNLEGLKQVSLSYNSIKGSIPSDFGKLNNLTMLHLHNNQLEGKADYFEYSIGDFITDCGNTYTSSARVVCIGCSSCCNVDGDCLRKNITWPRPGDVVHASHMEPRAFVFLMTLGSSLFLVLVLFVLSLFFGMNRNFICAEFQDESTYKFLLSKNYWAKSIAIMTVLLQLFLYSIFIDASDFTAVRNDWEYSTSCPGNSIDCEDKRGVSAFAWLAFSIILGAFLMKDIVEGIKMIYDSITLRSFEGVLAGFVVIYVTIASVEASVLYNYSTGISSTDILKDAVILLFLNDVDEQLYTLVRTVRPKWVKRRNENVKRWLRKEIRTAKSSRLGAAALHVGDEETSRHPQPTVENGNFVATARNDAQHLEREFEELTNAHINMRTIYAREISELKIKNEELENNHASLQNEHSSLEKKHTSLENEHAWLEGKYTSLENKHDALESKHASLEKEVANLKRSHLKMRTLVKFGENGTGEEGDDSW